MTNDRTLCLALDVLACVEAIVRDDREAFGAILASQPDPPPGADRLARLCEQLARCVVGTLQAWGEDCGVSPAPVIAGIREDILAEMREETP